MLTLGSQAPNFTLADQNGKSIEVSSFFGKSKVVLFFYPQDNTPGCTAESCLFRDHHDEFKSLGAEIIGISQDSVESHRAFANQHSLPYTLLTDTGNRVANLYGVKKTLGIFPGRVSFVIDESGKIIFSVSSQFFAKRHVLETLAALKNSAHSQRKGEAQGASF